MIDDRVATVVVPSAQMQYADADGVAAYLASADRMRKLADVVLKVGGVLAVLLLLAWVFGLLPGAVRLF